jgi:hypothetical protein
MSSTRSRAALRAGAALTALWCLAAGASLQAQESRYEGQVRYYLNLVKTFAETVGYRSTHEYHIGSLRDDQTDSYTVSFDGGWEYRIISLCDVDCSDIDLYLDDGSGRQVDSDEGTSDAPILELSPRGTERYTIRVRMYECKQDPCYYGVGVFGRRL